MLCFCYEDSLEGMATTFTTDPDFVTSLTGKTGSRFRLMKMCLSLQHIVRHSFLLLSNRYLCAVTSERLKLTRIRSLLIFQNFQNSHSAEIRVFKIC